ncbi:hypothetical protein PENTCL1PPCAC_9381, partial [Pristionchus entomophagus]
MDEEELLLHGDDGTAVITDHLNEEDLLNDSINGDAGSNAEESAAAVIKLESLDHEELDYEEEDEKEERESRFTSERAKKSPVRAPEEAAAAAAAKTNENTGIAGRGSYRGRVMRGGAGFRGGMGGNFNMRGGMRMVAGGGSAGPISLLTSNIPPPMMMAGPGIGGPLGKILVNPNFPVGAGLTLLPTPGPGGYGAPPMGLRGPMMAPGPLGPKVTLSIDGAPALAVPVNMPRAPPQMGPGPGGVPMSMPPPSLSMRPGGGPPLMLNPMAGPPPSAMRFPPGMGPPPMNIGMNVPPPGMAGQMAGGVAGNWNLMVEAFLGDKKTSASSGDRSKKKKRRRSRSSSYSSSSDSESSYSGSSRSRSRSPRRSRKRRSGVTRKHSRKERSSGTSGKAERAGERRVFRTGPNSFRINPAPANGGSELPSLLDGMERGGGGGGSNSTSSSSRSRRADRERQREHDSRDSARALGLDDDYLSKVEEQRRRREEELRRRKERSEGGGSGSATTTGRSGEAHRERAPATSSRGRNDSNGNGAAAKDARKKPEPAAVDDSRRKAYLAVHVKNVGSLGEAALGRVKALANEVGETKKVWRSADDVITVIFVELDKAKAFMLKYNGSATTPFSIACVSRRFSHSYYQRCIYRFRFTPPPPPPP